MVEASREVFDFAGVTSFAEIEQYANDLELAGETDISAVSESDIYQLYVMIEALVFFPSMQNIARYWRDLQGAITIVSVGPQSVYLRGVDGELEYSFDGEIWKSSFPPAAHTHQVSEIPNFPATMPPDSHNHVVADVTDFPETIHSEMKYYFSGETPTLRSFSLRGQFHAGVWSAVSVAGGWGKSGTFVLGGDGDFRAFCSEGTIYSGIGYMDNETLYLYPMGVLNLATTTYVLIIFTI